jgi:hypothetical protein
MFGGRLHLRVKAGQAESAAARLGVSIPARGGSIERLRSIEPQLEDVFIALLEDN